MYRVSFAPDNAAFSETSMQRDSRPIRILLIDDDQDDFFLIRDMLSLVTVQRYETSWVADYYTAMEELVEGGFDVCFLDYRLGSRDGIDLLKEALSRGCTTPVLLLTGLGDYGVDVEAMQAGAADYLIKDEINAGVLERSIRHSIERARLTAEFLKANDRLEERIQERTAELYKTNETLRESERFNRSVLDALPDHIAVLDAEGFILCTNRAWKIFALSNGLAFEPESIGVNYLQVCDRAAGLWAEEASIVAAGIREVISGKREFFEIEYPCNSPDESRWYNLRVTRFDNYSPAKVVVAHENVTERNLAELGRRQSEARGQHLNNVLLAMREVSSLLSREKDPARLLGAVCSSLVQTRGYIAVWIGQAEAGSKRVVPVAYSGVGSQMLDPITWDNSRSGQGPAGTAMRERRPVVFDDIANDERFTPWKEAVIGSGVACVASVPLISDERLFGVLTVKADRPHAFDTEEVLLLSGMATDIARRLQGLEDELSRLQTQKEAQAQQEMLEIIFDSSPYVMALVNNNGQIMKINDTCAAFSSRPKEEAIGLPAGELFNCLNYFGGLECGESPQCSGCPVLTRVAHTFETEESVYNAQGCISVRKGSVTIDVDVLISTAVVKYGGSKTVLLTMADITAIKRAERELAESEERFRLFVQEVRDYAILMLDPAGLVVSWNAGAELIEGYLADEILGKHISCFYTAEDNARRRPAEFLERAASQGRAEDEGFRVRKDGSSYLANVVMTALFDKEGRLRGFSTVTRDITERRRVEESLREREEQLRLFIEHAPVQLAMLDSEMRYLSASREWRTGYNLGERDLTGLSHYEVFPEIGERWKKVHRRALSGEVLRAEEDRFPRGDGSVQWIRWEVRPWRRAKGDVGGIVIFSEDISELRKVRELLRIERDLALKLGATEPLDLVMQFLLEACLQFEEFDSGGVYLFEGQTGALKLICHRGLTDVFVKQVSLFEQGSLEAQFALQGEPGYWSKPISAFGLDEPIARERLTAIVSIPVKYGTEVVALLTLASHDFPEIPLYVRQALEHICGHIGGVVARVRLSEDVKNRSVELKEANIALKLLLKQRELDRTELEEALQRNIKNLVFPYLEKLKKSRLESEQRNFLEILETHLLEIASPFVKRISAPLLGLTPTEIRVAELIRQGKSSKEIGELLGITEWSIVFHRRGIRKKLGLAGKKVNLQTYLYSIQ